MTNVEALTACWRLTVEREGLAVHIPTADLNERRQKTHPQTPIDPEQGTGVKRHSSRNKQH